jgi:hypothetical protein
MEALTFLNLRGPPDLQECAMRCLRRGTCCAGPQVVRPEGEDEEPGFTSKSLSDMNAGASRE